MIDSAATTHTKGIMVRMYAWICRISCCTLVEAPLHDRTEALLRLVEPTQTLTCSAAQFTPLYHLPLVQNYVSGNGKAFGQRFVL